METKEIKTITPEEIKKFAIQCTIYWNGLADNAFNIEDMEDYKTVVATLNILQNNYYIIPKKLMSDYGNKRN